MKSFLIFAFTAAAVILAVFAFAPVASGTMTAAHVTGTPHDCGNSGVDCRATKEPTKFFTPVATRNPHCDENGCGACGNSDVDCKATKTAVVATMTARPTEGKCGENSEYCATKGPSPTATSVPSTPIPTNTTVPTIASVLPTATTPALTHTPSRILPTATLTSAPASKPSQPSQPNVSQPVATSTSVPTIVPTSTQRPVVATQVAAIAQVHGLAKTGGLPIESVLGIGALLVIVGTLAWRVSRF